MASREDGGISEVPF